MRLRTITIILAAALCTGCTDAPHQENGSEAYCTAVSYVQDERQLYLDRNSYTPINFDYMKAVWLPYTEYAELLGGKSAEEVREALHERFAGYAAEGLNTVFVHVRAFGDAYYDSQIFPCGKYQSEDCDTLQIMLEEGHAAGLSVHAWINPLRCQSAEDMKNTPESFEAKAWTETADCGNIAEVNGYWWLEPSSEEAVGLICSGVDEIVRQYDVDGIHIDDYFCPAASEDFDKAAFEKSGSDDISEWRTANCSRMVSSIYDTVKAADSRVLFGISPQGNINADYSSQFADVRRWASEEGFCDYIVPQIYFGFNNESCPFEKTLAEWTGLTENSNVSLVIGLAEYKLGKADKWAGSSGENEWLDSPDIISRQTKCVENSSANGYAFYRQA